MTSGANGLAFSGPANSPAPSNTAPTYPASLTFANGVATANVTLYDAQTTTLTVGATGATSGTTPASFIVNPGAANKFTLSTPAPTAGTAFTDTITAIDAYANTATGFTNTECVALTGPANSPAPSNTAPLYPARGACAAGQSSLTFANGIDNAISITLYDAQTTTLTATQGLTTGASAAFTVSPAGAHTLTATSGSGQAAPLRAVFTNPLVATVTDLYSNPVPGVSVIFTAPGSGASSTFATCASNPANACVQPTGATGQATSSTFTANGTAGTYNITASATGTTSVTFSETNRAVVTVFASNSANSGGAAGSQAANLGSTPASASTVIVLVYAYGNGAAPNQPTISGNGITGAATLITNTTVPNTTNYEEWAFRANASGTGATYTATFTGGRRAQDIEVDAVALAGNNTGAPIAQSNNTDSGRSTTPTATLAATPAAGDMEIAFLAAGGNDGGVGAAPTGWTGIGANNNFFPTYGVASYDTNTNGATSTTFTFNTRVRWAAIALDIAHG